MATASGTPTSPGSRWSPTNIRFRDGSYSNFNNTDLNGYAGFNEVFPLVQLVRDGDGYHPLQDHRGARRL